MKHKSRDPDMGSIEVSIIIPYYNEAALLERLLRTIPNIPEVEVIVIDDHSTMNLSDYSACSDRFKDRNIYFLKNDAAKKGAGTARNKGMKYATGKWLLFADTDDRFLPDMWDHISAVINNEADVIFFSPTGIGEFGKPTRRHKAYAELVHSFISEHTAKEELRIRACFFSPCSKMVKRAFVETKNIMFDEILHGEDVMFSVRVGMEANTIEAKGQVIYEILDRSQSMTKKSDNASKMMRKKCSCRWLGYIHRNTTREERKYLGISFKSDIHKMINELQVRFYERKHGVL